MRLSVFPTDLSPLFQFLFIIESATNSKGSVYSIKKLFLLLTMIVISMFPVSAFGHTDTTETTIEYLYDGSYFETVIEDEILNQKSTIKKDIW